MVKFRSKKQKAGAAAPNSKKNNKRTIKRHYREWNESSLNIRADIALQRATLVDLRGVKEFDVVINKLGDEYRNQNLFIYAKGGLHSLTYDIDDYGALPEWVELNKSDCGHSYFKFIENNSLTPLKPEEWTMLDSHIKKSELKPFKFHTKIIHVTTQFKREKDGAKCMISVPILLSVPSLGGPVRNIVEGGSGSDWVNYHYSNGRNIRLRQDFLNGKYVLKQPLRSQVTSITISESDIVNAIGKVRENLRTFFNPEEHEVIYVDSIGPCQFLLPSVLVQDWKIKGKVSKQAAVLVLPLTK